MSPTPSPPPSPPAPAMGVLPRNWAELQISLSKSQSGSSSPSASSTTTTATIPTSLAPSTLSPIPQAQESFTLFPLLPTELRVKIWRFSLPGPRIVTVRYLEVDDKRNRICYSRAAIPEALSACCESRAEAMRFYKLSFGGEYAGREPRVWFDFSKDTFCIRSERIEQYYGDSSARLQMLLHDFEDVELIKRIAIDLRLLDQSSGRLGFLRDGVENPFAKLTGLVEASVFEYDRSSPLGDENGHLLAIPRLLDNWWQVDMDRVRQRTGIDWKLVVLTLLDDVPWPYKLWRLY